MRTLQEIAKAHHSGYLINKNYLNKNTVFSFCGGRLQDVRINNMILSEIDTVMDSGKDNSYLICDKYGNSLESLANTDHQYRIQLGYISENIGRLLC